MFDRQDRRHVAVVVTTDGRRVQVPVRDLELPTYRSSPFFARSCRP